MHDYIIVYNIFIFVVSGSREEHWLRNGGSESSRESPSALCMLNRQIKSVYTWERNSKLSHTYVLRTGDALHMCFISHFEQYLNITLSLEDCLGSDQIFVEWES